MAVTAAEFIIARTFVDSAWLRAPSGLFLGFAAAPFVILGIQEMVEVRFRHASM
jgi:hypothetical protein